jgi:hypothetical protein
MNITKRTRTTEVTEYIGTCNKCGKKITGSKESQVEFNMKVHQVGKECKND